MNKDKTRPMDPLLVQAIRDDLAKAVDLSDATRNLIDKDQVVGPWLAAANAAQGH